MEIIIYGIVNSLTLILMSIGFALAYGVSRIPNFAHGALFILTGYLTWLLRFRMDMPYGLAILLSLIIVAIIGVALYQIILIRVRGMPISEIIASFGVGLAILEFLRWSGLKGTAHMLPPFMSGSMLIFDVPLDYQRIIVVLGGVSVLLFLWFFTTYTKPGLSLKAIAQNERAGLVLGIDSDIAATLAVAIGAVFAGIAAIILLPLGNIVVEMGYEVLVFAIAVSVCGGLGSWKGAVIASFLIGFAQTITVSLVAPHYHFVTALFIIIMVLIFKPSGLFGRQKELEERV
ncbi:MAG: branched-chain amino acid ABC transporter permease [Bacillota bacterium]